MWNDLFGSGGASEYAQEFDLLALFLLGLTLFFTFAVALFVIWFSIQYRAREGHRARPARASRGLLLLWITLPFLALSGLYIWGVRLKAGPGDAPADSISVGVRARQWMWTFDHEDGPSEINALHIPVNFPVRLELTSEDVLHRLSLPAFRIQLEAVPGEKGSSEQWFRPTREGSYRFGCTEFCGSGHAEMSGTVYVLDPITYEHWVTGDSASMTPVEAGALLFEAFRCASCHIPEGGGSGPSLVGRFGMETSLKDGSSALFDGEYVRESLLEPKAKVAADFEPVMASYKGQLDETQIGQLSAYFESLGEL